MCLCSDFKGGVKSQVFLSSAQEGCEKRGGKEEEEEEEEERGLFFINCSSCIVVAASSLSLPLFHSLAFKVRLSHVAQISL